MVRRAHHPEQGRRTDGVSPVESRSITPQGGEAAAFPFGRTRKFKLRVRYNLVVVDNLSVGLFGADHVGLFGADHEGCSSGRC